MNYRVATKRDAGINRIIAIIFARTWVWSQPHIPHQFPLTCHLALFLAVNTWQVQDMGNLQLGASVSETLLEEPMLWTPGPERVNKGLAARQNDLSPEEATGLGSSPGLPANAV